MTQLQSTVAELTLASGNRRHITFIWADKQDEWLYSYFCRFDVQKLSRFLSCDFYFFFSCAEEIMSFVANEGHIESDVSRAMELKNAVLGIRFRLEIMNLY